jgi:hypothetical protein
MIRCILWSISSIEGSSCSLSRLGRERVQLAVIGFGVALDFQVQIHKLLLLTDTKGQ